MLQSEEGQLIRVYLEQSKWPEGMCAVFVVRGLMRRTGDLGTNVLLTNKLGIKPALTFTS